MKSVEDEGKWKSLFLASTAIGKDPGSLKCLGKMSCGAACVGVFLHNSSGVLGLFLCYRRKHVIANGVC